MEIQNSPFSIGLNPTQHQLKLLQPKKDEYDEEEVSPLHVASYYNKTEFIKTLIDDCQQDINSQDSNGTTPLMIAAKKGNIETIEELLKYNASKSATNKHGQTAILIALKYNQPEAANIIIQALPEPTLNLSATDNSGYNVLHYLGYCNDENILNVIEKYIYVDDMIESSINPSCSVPLHIAALNGSTQTVKWLLNHGASPAVENCMGQSPLLLAIKNNHAEVVDLLLEVSSPEIPDNYGQLALHYAAAVGCSVEIIQKIYNKFPKAMNKMDTNGNFPFHNAVKSNKRDVLDFFFKEGGELLLVKKNSNGMTPFMLAVACGAMESYKYLKEMKTDFYVKSMSGTSPFLIACAYGQLEMVRMLFKEDPSVICDEDNTKNTAAHYAVQNGKMDILKWIRKIAPEIVKKPNAIKETPLHIACVTGNKVFVDQLLSYGLSMTDVTTSGRTPFHYAVLGGHLHLIKQLRKNPQPQYFAADKNKLTPLHYCCIHGMVHLMDDLHSACETMINARDGCGRTPLHVAVVMNDPVCVKKLIQLGCDKEQLDIRKLSAQQSAINRGYIHCYELIGGVTTFTPIKKVKMITDFITQEEHLLRVKNNETVEVYWEHRKGWAIGGINGRYGLFPLSKGIVVPLDAKDQEKIQQVLANKKMVKRGADRKNRSASVAFKDGESKQQPQAINAAELLMQAPLPKPGGKRARKRVTASAADV